MSFSRSSALEAQPTNVHRSEDAEYSDDPEFRRFTTSLSSKLMSLTGNMNQLSAQISYLGTKRESERVRERVQNLLQETGNGFKEIGDGLKRITTWPDLGPTQRFTQGKLNQEFKTSFTQFQLLQNQALERQRAARTALEQDADRTSGSGQQLASSQQQQQQVQESRMADQSEVDFQSSLIIERETEIRQIEQSVGELNELFRDVATMVHEQGQQLDTIGENVQITADETHAANNELTAAQRYQRSSRNKACCLLLVLAIVLIVVILAVVIG